jgi:hypothetical protein
MDFFSRPTATASLLRSLLALARILLCELNEGLQGLCLRFTPTGKRPQVVSEDRIDAGALLERTDAGTLQDLVIDRDGEIGHGFSVARDPCLVLSVCARDQPRLTSWDRSQR